ncbi:IPT/TIG domain-containing protein [Sphingobacterium sp. HJSM2_6]|uniref:IPT/TIG domain-containing protein n=1 Tax=Sphingobacterium sp. HJSM2_6 TaxID=3366264 RepID=UPI003BCDF778
MKNIKEIIGILLFSTLFMLFSCKKEINGETTIKLSVEEYFPNSGKAGTLVTIKGAGFSTRLEDNIVEFSGVAAEVFSAQSTELVVLAPKAANTGQLTVKNGSQTIDVGTYTYQSLSLKKIYPTNGPAGSNIRISGEGFSSLNQPAKVIINDSVAKVVNISDTLIVAKVPINAGTGPVKVFVDNMESKGEVFTYQEITGIKPLTGGPGTKITIKGEGFETVKERNIVFFNDKQASVLQASPNQLIVVAPEGVMTNKAFVIINGQKMVSSDVFRVVPLPEIAAVSPLSGPVGSVITIKGTSFSEIKEENKVLINGKEIPFEKDPTGTELVVKYPADIGSGKVEVIVNDQKVLGPEFKNQDLGISKVSPESGLEGTEVTIHGTGFSKDLIGNTVSFNGLQAQIISATDNSLKVIAPTNLSTGPLKVQVGALSAFAPQSFRRSGVMTIKRGITELNYNYSKIVIDSKGNLYVSGINSIRKFTQQGEVSVLATGFTSIFGMDILNDVIYVADSKLAKKVTLSGQVSTIPTAELSPYNLSVDEKGNLYYPNSWHGVLKVALPSGTVQNMNSGGASDKCRIAIAKDGTIYHAIDDYEGIINRTLPGERGLNWIGQYGVFGLKDGPISQAEIGFGISALKINNANNLIIMDATNYAIREVDLKQQTIKTLINVERGFVDGDFSSAKWGNISDIAIDKDGAIYLLDVGQGAIRKVIFK